MLRRSPARSAANSRGNRNDAKQHQDTLKFWPRGLAGDESKPPMQLFVRGEAQRRCHAATSCRSRCSSVGRTRRSKDVEEADLRASNARLPSLSLFGREFTCQRHGRHGGDSVPPGVRLDGAESTDEGVAENTDGI